MKAFEEWYVGHDQDLADSLNKGKRGFELGLRIGWEAALEWIDKEATRLNCEEGYHLVDVFKLSKVIREELSEETNNK